MPPSLDNFISELTASGVMTAEQVNAALASLDSEAKPPDVEQLARQLVRDGKLTAYQARLVYHGKGKDLVLGSYAVLDMIGQGGMGVVLKAKHRRMDRIVALKVLSPRISKNAKALQRFHREIRAAASLAHPNIVRAFDAGEDRGIHFLVMEYVAGEDLSSLVKRQGALAVNDASGFTLQAAWGLHYAHEQGVIHRDIKPSNLLLDESGTVKILDMGLARMDVSCEAESELTGADAILGTVDYMPPEQALSTHNVDARADIYSLGISLWYLLNGKPAYGGDSVTEKLLAHREAPIPAIRDLRPDVPPALETVFRKMVAKQADQRYASMAAVIQDLELLCDDTQASGGSGFAQQGGRGNVGCATEADASGMPGIAGPKANLAAQPMEQAFTDADTDTGITLTREVPLPPARPKRRQKKGRWPIWIAPVVAGVIALVLLVIVCVVMSQRDEHVAETDPQPIDPAVAENIDVAPPASQPSLPEAPDLLVPAPEAMLSNGSWQKGPYIWHFSWSPVADALHYHLHVIGDNATIAGVDNTGIEETNYTLESRGYIIDQNLRNWRWKVRAMTSSGWSEWSDTHVFHVAPLPPRSRPVSPEPPLSQPSLPKSPVSQPSLSGAPDLLMPASEAILSNGSWQKGPYIWHFSWSPVADALHYHLHVIGDNATIAGVDNTEIEETNYMLESRGYIIDQNLRNWRWKVRAMTSSGWTPWSDTRVFHVAPLPPRSLGR